MERKKEIMEKLILLCMFAVITIGLILTHLGVCTVLVYFIGYLLNCGFGLTQLTWGQSFIVALAIYITKVLLGIGSNGDK
jgi:hypothetical protein